MSITRDVAAYWAELQRPVLISRSHFTLMDLYGKYGSAAVDEALEVHIKAERAEIAAREAVEVAAFYARYGICSSCE